MTEASSSAKRRPVIGLVLAFVFGLFLMGWLLAGTQAGRELLGTSPVGAPQRMVSDVRPAAPAVAGPPSDQAFRLATLEARVAQLEARPAGSGGNAASAPKAEALFLVLAASRRIERGEALAGLEPELLARFGATEPAALQALSQWSRRPVSPEAVKASFMRAEKGLAGGEGWWDSIRSTLSNLVSIREGGRPAQSPAHAARQAGQLVEQGRFAEALALLRTLPVDAKGRAWVGDATRLVEARKAIAALENRALEAPPVAPAAATPAKPDAPATPQVPSSDPEPLTDT